MEPNLFLHARDLMKPDVITTFDLMRVLSRGSAPYPGLIRHTGYRRGELK